MNRRPIVYTIREIRTYNNEYEECRIGYFVSRVYVTHLDITYHKTGAEVKKYDIDFCDMIYTDFNSTPIRIVENGSKNEAYQSKIFKDYVSCKKYVDQQNYIFETTVGTTSASKMAKRMELHKQALKFGAKLEDKYIPLEERQQVSESAKNI